MSAERAFGRVLALASTEATVDHEDVRRTLDRYIKLLVQTGREGEAAALIGQAEALRTPAEGKP